MGPVDLENLTAVQVAELLGVSDRAVRKWVKEKGLPQNPGVGVMSFAWPKVLAWDRNRAREEGGTDGTNVNKTAPEPVIVPNESYEDALKRKTRAEADLKELQLARERGQVASIEDVERALSASTKATQTQILAVPTRVANRVLGLDDYGRAVAIIESEMRQLLSNLGTIDAVREAALAASGAE